MNLQQRLEATVGKAEIDAELLHDIVHGDTDTEVQTEGGPVKTVARAIQGVEDDLTASRSELTGQVIEATRQATLSASTASLSSLKAGEAAQTLSDVRALANAATSAVIIPTQTWSANASQTDYRLNYPAGHPGALQVTVAGVLQTPIEAYSLLDAHTLRFVAAPVAGVEITVRLLDKESQTGAAAAMEWATKTAGPVQGSEYSAKYHAQSVIVSAAMTAQKALDAAGSASAAALSGTAAAVSATSAANSLAAVNSVFDTFDDRFLGAKASDPSTDNDGNPILAGAVYYSSASSQVKFYNGAAWESPALSASTSATNAFNLANASSASATNSASSATASAASAVTAVTKAVEAATSATGAATSAANSTGSAVAAANAASAAAGSASTASTKATEANASAGNASTSAATATTKASEASSSAANAASSASAAAGSALSASGSASTASTKASEAAGSAATASTKATESSSSASSAAGSASAANTSSSQANSFASSASGSASTATSAANNAQTYATQAQAAAASASGSNVAPQVFAGNGSATDFVLATASSSVHKLIVSVANVVQDSLDAYLLINSGATLRFSAPPASDSRIVVRYI